jgi:hypothetical protein
MSRILLQDNRLSLRYAARLETILVEPSIVLYPGIKVRLVDHAYVPILNPLELNLGLKHMLRIAKWHKLATFYP